MRQARESVKALLASTGSANGAPSGNVGINMQTTFGVASRTAKHAIIATASTSGIFTLWGRIGATWGAIGVMNSGEAVAGTRIEIAENLGAFDDLYLQVASLTGTASASIAAISEHRS